MDNKQKEREALMDTAMESLEALNIDGKNAESLLVLVTLNKGVDDSDKHNMQVGSMCMGSLPYMQKTLVTMMLGDPDLLAAFSSAVSETLELLAERNRIKAVPAELIQHFFTKK